ncbi:phage portal protein [Allokutzneria sp. A3M-2-11 16]|uniref:phage portal protein n=1 Tax=Allokutzneria sp. A3M-2-11 16 TaxID=2962043 RepID=UPI0020B86686|nr:phage portal protein [Allokutzneria sp. A3M-2-11 16]MCP3805382.1 phage portal protein [Allokutzneria sp. A3M-2-11 16]
MKLIERLGHVLNPRRTKGFSEPPFWDLDRAWSLLSGGLTGDREQIASNFEGYIEGAYKASGPVFACILTRQLVFSEATFLWQRNESGRPGELFTAAGLELLSTPWPGGTTGELLSRMEVDASLAGNFYATVADDRGRLGRAATGPGRRIVRMRPDRVTILIGSNSDNPNALDARTIAYLYDPPTHGGVAAPEPVVLLPEEVCHYSPIPDASARFRGMSWLTPVLREVQADKAANVYRDKFFSRGARPGLVVTFDKDTSPEKFKQFVEMFRRQHEGADNAYKTLFMGGGADVSVLAADFQKLDFRAIQGAGETRIAAAAGVPPVIVGLSEGLAAATYSNYSQARRRFADGTMRPLWRMAAASLQRLTAPPTGSRLAVDTRDIAFLREDERDAAEIQGIESRTIRTLVDAGYTAESVLAAVAASDWSLLHHSGLFSVQLQKPGGGLPSSSTPATGEES